MICISRWINSLILSFFLPFVCFCHLFLIMFFPLLDASLINSWWSVVAFLSRVSHLTSKGVGFTSKSNSGISFRFHMFCVEDCLCADKQQPLRESIHTDKVF